MSLLPNRTQPNGPESDMTPMVDVTFLLLIFFMVTASFTLQRSLAIPKPTDKRPQLSPTETVQADIIVEVDEFNTFHVVTASSEQEAPSAHDLVRTLRRIRESNTNDKPLNRMLVKASGEALHEKVVAALDSGAYVGIPDIALLTIE